MITYSSMLILVQGLFLSHFFMSTNGFSPSSLSAIKVTHLGLRFPPIKATRNVVYDTEGVVLDKKKDPYLKEEDGKEIDYVDAFCRWTNSAFRNLTIEPVRDFLEIIPAQTNMTFFEKLTTPPQYPGLPRPVSLTILASVPTALGWYGFYKFSVEEELFQDELRREGRVTGCGGYGTLLPFVFLFLFGGFFGILGAEDLSNQCLRLGGIWILAGQINLYRRVNELYTEKFQGEAPLHEWWALLPPPLDVVVGLRQVHTCKILYEYICVYFYPIIYMHMNLCKCISYTYM